MPPAQKWSTLKKERKALQTLDGSGCHPVCINNKWYVPWTFPTLDVHDSSTLELCTPCNAKDDKEDNNFPISNIEYETTHDNAILSDNVPDNDIFPESDVESITMETSTDSNKEYQKPTYAAMMEISNKIISFPELKKKVDSEFLCKECIFTHGIAGISASTLSVQQDTYGIATVVQISCGNNHIVGRYSRTYWWQSLKT